MVTLLSSLELQRRRTTTRSSLRRVSYSNHLIFPLAGWKHDAAEVPDRSTPQRPDQRRIPADPTLAGVRLVITDKGQHAFVVILVGDGDGGAEPHLAAVLLAGGIDDLGRLHPLGEPTQPPIDLAEPLATIDIVAILRPVAITSGPGDGVDQLGPLDRE